MLISCKCLNFIASSNCQQTPHKIAAANNNAAEAAAMSSVSSALMSAFLQKFPRNFTFYSQCMDFISQLIGPIPDLTINAISQRDLIYSITLDVQQTWQISICINCNAVVCAKQLPSPNGIAGGVNAIQQYLINGALLTNIDELSQRRADRSYSETFGLLIMDHPQLQVTLSNDNSSKFIIGSLSTTTNFPLDSKQLRLRQLQLNLNQRLKREITDTEERIQRYSDQQFALLKSFREKSEQEYELLARLINHVADQQASGELLDRQPPALDISGGVNYTTRRRNTISSRRDLQTAPTTPTSQNPPATIMLTLPTAAAIAPAPAAAAVTSAIEGARGSIASIANRKMSNFDTPPATPEATPMSVGNSPTFRQQQQQQQAQQQTQQPFGRLTTTASFQQQFPTPTVETADDFLFELEGVDVPPSNAYAQPLFKLTQPQQNHHALLTPQQLHQQTLYNHLDKNMSDDDIDDDNGDVAEEAENAVELDSSMPIPMEQPRRSGVRRDVRMLNFAKSLPIQIGNSPMAERQYVKDVLEEEELELDGVDIAASIKALARSVHGEAVHGDLPRPRFRSQI